MKLVILIEMIGFIALNHWIIAISTMPVGILMSFKNTNQTRREILLMGCDQDH